MHLTPLTQTDPPTQRVGRKIGFCLFDTNQMPVDQRPPAWGPQTYTNCGTQKSLRVLMGISVGWGDAYLAWFQFQAIDVTGLPSGPYRLCSIVNPQPLWLEKSPDNNTAVGRRGPGYNGEDGQRGRLWLDTLRQRGLKAAYLR